MDDNFVIKNLPQVCCQCLFRFVPEYWDYVEKQGFYECKARHYIEVPINGYCDKFEHDPDS